MLTALLLGTVFGFISAIPVAGPVSAIIFGLGMKRQYSQGRWVALGAGLAESVYAFIAFWGFTHFIVGSKYIALISNAVAAVILAALGLYFYRSKRMRHPAEDRERDTSRSSKAFLTGAGICAFNPSLIATWTAGITSLYSAELFEFTTPNGLAFSVGVWTGIVLWFTTMLKLMRVNAKRLNDRVMDRGLKGMGIFLLILSGVMVYRLLHHR